MGLLNLSPSQFTVEATAAQKGLSGDWLHGPGLACKELVTLSKPLPLLRTFSWDADDLGL